MLSSDHLFEFCEAPHGLLCSFPRLYLFVQTWRRTLNSLHWTLSSMCSWGKKGVTVPAICKVHNTRQLAPLNKSPLSVVPTGGAVYPTGAHRVNILEFLPRDKWFVLRNCCWEGRKKKSPFFIIPRCILICTSDIVSVMDYTKGNITAQQARQGKKIREIWGGLKTTYCNAEFW